MPKNLKYLVRKILSDIRQLYLVLEKTLHPKENEYFEFRKEIDERLTRINENSEHLYEVINDIDWDNRTNRKFQKLNALLLIIPTIIGLMLLIGGITKFSANSEISDKVRQEIVFKDSLIKQLKNFVANLPDTTVSKIQLADSIKNLNQAILEFENFRFNTRYFRYDFTGKPDSINLKTLNVDILILKNNTDKQLGMSVRNPKDISPEDFLYTSADSDNSFNGGGGYMAPGQFIIVSVEILKRLKQDVTLEFFVPSIKVQPPFQQLTLQVNK